MESIISLIAVLVLFAVIFKKAVLAAVATEWYKKWFTFYEYRAMVFGPLQKLTAPTKLELFGNLKKSLEIVEGDVLEIGIGGGTNLQYYPAGTALIALDPNPYAEKLLRESIKKTPLNFHLKSFIVGSSEDMRPKGTSGIADKSIAVVVCTYVLCSMGEAQLQNTLQEVKRVLKPGGKFFFLEHIRDTSGTLRNYMQQLIETSGLWTAMAGGCHVSRQTWLYLEEAGFKSLSYNRFSFKQPQRSWLYRLYSPQSLFLYLVSSTLSGWAEM